MHDEWLIKLKKLKKELTIKYTTVTVYQHAEATQHVAYKPANFQSMCNCTSYVDFVQQQ